jgi:hypothetical protein
VPVDCWFNKGAVFLEAEAPLIISDVMEAREIKLAIINRRVPLGVRNFILFSFSLQTNPYLKKPAPALPREAVAVFTSDDERLNHFRLFEVAAKLIQFIEDGNAINVAGGEAGYFARIEIPSGSGARVVHV